MATRQTASDRKQQILTVALKQAEKPGGWTMLTRASVAAACGVTPALVTVHFGTMANFRRAIMRAAISGNNLSIIGQGVAANDKYANKVHKDVRSQALKHAITA